MAVSNPATLESVYTEFGAPQGTGLSAFLRGGAYVPNVSQNANVPTALPISLSQLAGAVKYVPITANITPTSLSASGKLSAEPINTGTATCNASGGNGSTTYTWSRVSGATQIQASSAGNLCGFSVPTGTPIGTYNAVWQCTASDGTSSASPTVSVQIIVTSG
jgi:hypothetical protein